MKANKDFLIILIVSFLNFWIWKVFRINLMMFFLMISLTLLIFNSTKERFSTRSIFLPMFTISVIVILLILDKGIDRTIWNMNQSETFFINQRRQFYPTDLGKLLQNRINLSFYKLEKNFFDNLDPNLYFFASHPRERSGIDEFEKFSFILLFFFLIGLGYLLIYTNLTFIFYAAITVLLSAFIDPSIRYGPIFFFPLICLVISTGLLQTIKLLEKKIDLE